jgi:hypothetical protein
MENHDRYLHHPSPSRASAATSAVGLASTAVGISAPPSPALEPSDSILARRRSWGNRLRESEGGSSSSSSSEPTQLELDNLAQVQTSPRRVTTNTRPVMGQQNQDANDERSRTHPYVIDPALQYGPMTGVMPDDYADSMAGPSTTSLMPHQGHFEHEMEDGHREDDEAHLTANMLSAGIGDESPEGYSSGDPEYDGATTPRTRRRPTVRYSVSPSPLKKTESAMKSVSKNLKRMSLRVVNLANTGLEGQLRLGDGEDTARRKKGADDEGGPPAPDLKQALPIRGRTLGFLGPDSKLRLSLFNFLVHP